MRIFVTGGSGFVGGHAIEALAADHEVLAMARSEQRAAIVSELGATPVRCHLGAVPVEALAGVEAIVHCAAFVEQWGTREAFFETNVEGTRQLIAAAREAGVKRLIHIGTEAALFDGRPLVEVTEEMPYPTRQRFVYSETKAEAERLVLAANDSELTTISLRPRLIWGPRDASVLPAVLEMAKKGAFVWLDGGAHQTSTCHVQNLAHAITLALDHGRGGEAYFIADEERSSLRAFLTALAATESVALPARSIPGWVARSLASLVEGTWRLLRLRSQPPLTRFAASMMSREVTVCTEKARRELSYVPTLSVAEGLAAMTPR